MRTSTLLLTAVLTTLIVIDLTLLPTAIAEESTTVAEVPPEIVPAQFFLGGFVVDTTVVEGLSVRVESFGKGVVRVSLDNPSTHAITLDKVVTLQSSSGDVGSRMGPMTFNLGTERVLATVPAGQSMTVDIAHSLPEGAGVNALDFGTGSVGQPMALLQWPDLNANNARVELTRR